MFLNKDFYVKVVDWVEGVMWRTLKRNIADTLFWYLGYEPIHYQPDITGLAVYIEERPNFITITKIIVPSEFDKEQLLLGSKYIHDLRCIDTDIQVVNLIAHLHTSPDLIEVANSL